MTLNIPPLPNDTPVRPLPTPTVPAGTCPHVKGMASGWCFEPACSNFIYADDASLFDCCEQEGPDVCEHGPYLYAVERESDGWPVSVTVLPDPAFYHLFS